MVNIMICKTDSLMVCSSLKIPVKWAGLLQTVSASFNIEEENAFHPSGKGDV